MSARKDGTEGQHDLRLPSKARWSLMRHLALALSIFSMVIPMKNIISDAINSNMPRVGLNQDLKAERQLEKRTFPKFFRL